jgi:hypothetical protein
METTAFSWSPACGPGLARVSFLRGALYDLVGAQHLLPAALDFFVREPAQQVSSLAVPLHLFFDCVDGEGMVNE